MPFRLAKKKKTLKAIIGLDLSTSTGWALRDRLGTISSGVQKFELARGDSVGMRFLRFRKWLLDKIQCVAGDGTTQYYTNAVDLIAVERAHHRGGAATALCVGLSTVVLEEAARLNIETTYVHTATLKKFLTGNGRASKEEMIQEATSRFSKKHLQGRIIGDDEADALGILEWARLEIGE